ncbi:MAG: SPOR domain-containing protein [Alphaproteobacteria bacterium]|nr:SPOR domain-containing protein [Alphaproteobacteria bacterium]
MPADDHPKPNAAPRVAVTSKALPPPPGARQSTPRPNRQVAATTPQPLPRPAPRPQALAKVDGHVETVPLAKVPTVYVQAGAFSQYANAFRLQVLLKRLAPSTITQVQAAEAHLFRVRLGPVTSVEEADALLAQVVASGVPEARIIVD